MKNNQEVNKKQRWSLRKSTKGIASALLGFTILTSGLVPQAEAMSIHEMDIVEIPTEDSVAPAKYAVIAGVTDKTEVIPFGEEVWVETEKATNNGTPVIQWRDPSDDLKGKIGLTYTHIGNYKGKDLDLKITVNDWKKAGFKGKESFSFDHPVIGMNNHGYDYVDVSFEYIYSDTGKPATDLTGTYMTVVDIDANQGMGFSEAQMKNIGKVYAPAESKVDVEKKPDGYTYFQDIDNADWNASSPEAQFTILADGHTLDFRWVKNWEGYNMDQELDWETSKYGQWFGYTAEKPVRTEVLAPTKLVTDNDEVDVLENQLKVIYERYEYDISHTVPAEYPEFFYKEYIMEDLLNDVLETGEVTVFNEDDEDVTHLFENLSEGNLVKFKATEDALSNKDFYGHTYRFNLKTNVKEGADLSQVTDGDGNIQIPNKAMITKDGKEQKDTETTITHVPTPVDPSVDKTIINADGEDVTENEVNIGSQFQYRVTATFPNKQQAENLGVFDDVPDALAVDSVVVLDEAGNDITEQGVLDINNEDESFRWTANDPTEFVGQTIQVIPTVSVKDTVSFAEFEEDGKFVFKNTAQLFVDDETFDSPEVTTTLEKVNPEINKGIVAEDGLVEENEVSIDETFEYQIDTTYGNETVPSILGLQDDVPDGFNLDSVVVFDADGNDVTEQGMLEIDEEKESFKWTANEPKQFVGKSLNTKVQVTVKDDFDFTEFKDTEDTFVFENTAQMITSDSEGNEKYDDSNPVVSKMKRVENAIVKAIIDKDGNEVSGNEVERGETYKYRVTKVVSNEQNIESLTFTDDLEDMLDVIETNVYVLDESSTIDGEVEEETIEDESITETVEDESEVESVDITQVEVNVTDDTKIVSWETEGNLNELKGQTIVTEIDVQIPEDAEISELPTEDDKHVILNTATSTVNETELSSNEVKTLVPQDEEEPIVETAEEPNAPEQEQEAPKKDPEQVKEGWLPHTGTEVNYAIIFGGMSLLAAAGYALYRIRKSQS